MQVRTNGLEVDTVQIVIRFNPRFLEVDGARITPHPDSLLKDFTVENDADNVGGILRYAIVNSPFVSGSVSGNFDLATVTLRGKTVTPEGGVTEVAFLVDDKEEGTSALSGGDHRLKNRDDFTGAWIRVIP